MAGGGDRQIFAEECFAEIFRYTGGVPRLVNTLCDTSLMAAFTSDRDTVQLVDIHQAIEELQWVDYSARNALHMKVPVEPRYSESPAPGGVAPVDDGQPIHGRLLVATDGRTVEERMLRVGRIIVGRTPDNDLQIDSRFVSRHHCQIVTTLHSSVIEDLNSTNGIYVKSKRVRRHYLNDGDVVVIGKHELIYVDELMARSRAAMTDTVPGVHIQTGVVDTGVVDQEQLE